jgi:hypothetical protein
MPSETEILEMAIREVSPEHVDEFTPITRGPIYAIVALIPLCIMAAACLVWKKLPWSAR